MKNIFSVLIILFFLNDVFAQENKAVQLTPHRIGLQAGFTTGLGFSYQYWPKYFGVQLTGIPLFRDNRNFTSVGLSLLAKLRENERVNLFGYFGHHLILRSRQVSNYNPTTGINETEIVKYQTYNMGLGLGVQIIVADVINLNFQTGYGGIDITGSTTGTIVGEFGVYYNL